ncbi:hypothetical protein GWK36_14190 [Caldichromatium japonicum]|uniref:Uncharacterized protein n=1 Tax=Caldichromatium japonicum TaxID=2699430 RepID=A0A6G7VGH7_9GAMM|nr:hypothetical protein [Caldichromatium japonicum]QIK38948.1 hypothetical protein GWK36_14190 [Caldichromatium japonicum]
MRVSISMQVHLGLLATGLAVAGAAVGGVYLAGAPLSTGIIVYSVLLGLVAVFVPVWILSGSLGRPLELLHQAVAATRRDGDLTREVTAPPASPIAPLATACWPPSTLS